MALKYLPMKCIFNAIHVERTLTYKVIIPFKVVRNIFARVCISFIRITFFRLLCTACTICIPREEFYLVPRRSSGLQINKIELTAFSYIEQAYCRVIAQRQYIVLQRVCLLMNRLLHRDNTLSYQRLSRVCSSRRRLGP